MAAKKASRKARPAKTKSGNARKSKSPSASTAAKSRPGKSRSGGAKHPKPKPSEGPHVPIAKGSFEHIVIILKENHTFDAYFGAFPGANGVSNLAHASDPPKGTFSNNHAAWLARAKKAIKEQYQQSDIPAYWSYAQQFTLCDTFHTDVASDSTPNHLMLIAADSPVINNPPFDSTPSYNIPSVPQNLQAAGLTWRNYGGYAFPYIASLKGDPWNVAASQFVTDAQAGNLPSISYVYPPDPLSEHPLDNVAQGMQWTLQQVNAIVQGGLWPKTAVFISWDDWGGWYDHVTPPNVEKWTDGTQFRYGSRVPCLVMSPYTKAGYVSKVLHSFVSIVRFCEENFGLPTINQRDASADNMADCFDFAQKPLGPPK